MKLLVTALLTTVATAATASADVVVYNATQAKMKVDVTLPNGSVKSATLDEAVDSIDDAKFTFAAGVKTVKVAVSDDTGNSVWSGTLGFNDAGVIVPTKNGATYVAAGTYSGNGEWKAAAFLNITGDSLTLDLEGHNGLGAHRKIAPTTTSFDLKKAIKLDPRESTFSITLHVQGQPAPLELGGSLNPGKYNVLWKRSRDNEYRVLSAGYLPPPPKSKR